MNLTGYSSDPRDELPFGLIVVVAGLVAVVIMFVVATTSYRTAADVATATAPATGVVAALVGGYFGIRGSSLAQRYAAEAAGGAARPDETNASH